MLVTFPGADDSTTVALEIIVYYDYWYAPGNAPECGDVGLTAPADDYLGWFD